MQSACANTYAVHEPTWANAYGLGSSYRDVLDPHFSYHPAKQHSCLAAPISPAVYTKWKNCESRLGESQASARATREGMKKEIGSSEADSEFKRRWDKLSFIVVCVGAQRRKWSFKSVAQIPTRYCLYVQHYVQYVQCKLSTPIIRPRKRQICWTTESISEKSKNKLKIK